MKKLFLKGVNRLLTGLLGVLGFGGCIITTGPGEMVAEYGSPYASYTVKGAVTDKASGDPVSGIRVSYSPTQWDEDAFGPPPEYPGISDVSVLTGADGSFTLTDYDYYFGYGEPISVYFEDVDGEENGSYQPGMYTIDFTNVEATGGQGWYRGECTVTKNMQLAEVTIDE